jgi:hypothetical protein
MIRRVLFSLLAFTLTAGPACAALQCQPSPACCCEQSSSAACEMACAEPGQGATAFEAVAPEVFVQLATALSADALWILPIRPRFASSEAEASSFHPSSEKTYLRLHILRL